MLIGRIVKKLIDQAYDIENVQKFRKDIKYIVYDQSDKFDRWNDTPENLKRQIREGQRQAKNKPWPTYSLIFGVIGIGTSFIGSTPFSLFIGFVGVVLVLVSVTHSATVEILSYDVPIERKSIDSLKFMSAWNRGPLNSKKSVLIFLVAFLMKISPQGYQLALWLMGDDFEK